MAENLAKWPSGRGPISKTRPSDGCGRDAVPLAVERWYDFHGFGYHLGNVGGTVPSVRVDRNMGDSVLSSEKHTSGFLDLIAFPDDQNKLSGSDVTGNFEFETENLKGQRIRVKGEFSFEVK